jgi:pimeloyl-ACP methyl ester carboxylesterase
MPVLNYNNGKINYNVTGEGDPIVLIHGFGLDSRIWEKQVEQLSKTNKVITYDLRGFGKSSIPNGKYSHTEDLHELLKELGIQKAKIVGHSFGGEIAVEYALEYPNEVNNLVLISPSLRGVKGDTSEWEALEELGKTGNIEALRKRILENPLFKNLKEGSRVKELINEIVKDYSGFHFMNRDPREIIEGNQEIKNISCPVEVVIGEKDEEIQKEVAKKFKNEIGVETKVIPNCGHIGILEEQELTEIIKDSSKEEFHSESSVIS